MHRLCLSTPQERQNAATSKFAEINTNQGGCFTAAANDEGGQEMKYESMSNEELVAWLKSKGLRMASAKWSRSKLEENCEKRGLVILEDDASVVIEIPRNPDLEFAEGTTIEVGGSPTIIDASEKDDAKQEFSHPTKVRCGKLIHSNVHPAFLNVSKRCETIMAVERYVPGTNKRMKRYVCPVCGHKKDIEGTKI